MPAASPLEKILSPLMRKKDNNIRLSSPVPDCIPYACHYSDHSILTKNGELLQTIKITGFANETVGKETTDLRQMIRNTIETNIDQTHFSLWIHTIRRKQNLTTKGEFPEFFSNDLHQQWNAKNKWQDQYVNEVYISIIHRAMPLKNGTAKERLKGFISALSTKFLTKEAQSYLAQAHNQLEQKTSALLKDLKSYGARRLGVVKFKNIYYSQPLQFFTKLLYLRDTPVPLPAEDLSSYLAGGKIAFGFNAAEIIHENHKHFSAAFTLKQYHELPMTKLDDFLQLPMEFIITQTMNFVDPDAAKEQFETQQNTLAITEDQKLTELLHLPTILDKERQKETSFCQSQMSIIIIGNSLKLLEENVAISNNSLCSLGIVAVRRDLRLEECFWAQLPANFSFVSRLRFLPTCFTAGFASLYNFPAGKRLGNPWGPAVTVFRTVNKTPYFFSFHAGETGHTAIIGPKGSGKTVLMNFLTSEARKFGGRVFFFDQNRASKAFITAINGHYTIINPDAASPGHSFAPLLIEKNELNQRFLLRWLGYLLEANGHNITDETNKHFASALSHIYQLPQEERHLSALIETLPAELQERLSSWHKEGKYAHLFDNQLGKMVDLSQDIYGFGMSQLVKDDTTLIPVLSYLMHRIEMSLDGRETIVIFDEAWSLVNNATIAPLLDGWLSRLNQKNAVVIFATQSASNSSKSQITSTITEQISTQIFLPNPKAEAASKAYQKVWGLQEEEFQMLLAMKSGRHEFLLKQRDRSVVASIDLKGLNALEILSGSDKTVTMIESYITEMGEDAENWVPAFYQKS